MFNQYYQPLQKYEIIKVNGENGAKAFQMLPNSSVLLLDQSAPLVWLAQTDGAGYKTVTAFEIKEHIDEPEISLKDIQARLIKLEGMINESYSEQNKQSAEQSAESGIANKERKSKRVISTDAEQ